MKHCPKGLILNQKDAKVLAEGFARARGGVRPSKELLRLQNALKLAGCDARSTHGPKMVGDYTCLECGGTWQPGSDGRP